MAMEQVWREAPLPALRVWHGAGGGVEANAAARVLAPAAGERAWEALAASAPAGAGDAMAAAWQAALPPVGPSFDCRRVPLPDGALIWLVPVGPTTPLAPGEPVEPVIVDDGARLALLRDLGRVGLWVRDLRTHDAAWDRHMFELFGLPVGDCAPHWSELLARCVHPDDRVALDRHYRAAAQTPGRGDVHFRVRRPDGEVRFMHSLYEVRCDAGGRPARMVGVIVDDTEGGRRLLEGERSRRDLLRALELAEVQVWKLDPASGRVFFNPVDFGVVGMEAAVDGVPIEQARASIHPDDRAAVVAAAQAAAAGERVVEAEARYRARDGRWRRLLSRRVAERGADGRVEALLGVTIDVTERHRLEQAEREAEREAVLAARASRDKSAFMALMSHRLRTPLNAVLGFAQLIAQDTAEPLSPRQRDRLARIDVAGHELLALLDDVFEVATLDDAGTAPTALALPLADVLAQVAQAVDPLARQRGVTLQWPGAEGLPIIAGDRRLLVQALRHLVAHAVRGAAAGASVVLAADTGSAPVGVQDDGRDDGRDDGPPRFRLVLRASQVGHITAPRAPRWDYRRRLELALALLVDDRLDALISGEHPFAALPALMARLAHTPAGALCERIRYD